MMNDFKINGPDFSSASCNQIGDPELFFPEGKQEQKEKTPLAKKVCGGCVHRVECLEFALDEFITYGIWGGLTARERTKYAPRRPSGRIAGAKGEQAFRLQQRGSTLDEIAFKLNMTKPAVVQALVRHRKKKQGGNNG